MAELIVTGATDKILYSQVASVKRYSEPHFEKMLVRYGEDIFSDYHVLPCKKQISSPGCDPSEPDLILIEKNFKKWVIVEIELCHNPKAHTINQIRCFSHPEFDSKKMAKYLVENSITLSSCAADIEYMFDNVPSEFIVVMDDYSNDVFERYRSHVPGLKICVLELYKTVSHDFPTYRFGGDYPYVLQSQSKLIWIDDQHFIIQNTSFAASLPSPGTFQLNYHMDPFDVSVFYSSKAKKYYLKMPEHHLPRDLQLKIGIDIHGKYVLQRF